MDEESLRGSQYYYNQELVSYWWPVGGYFLQVPLYNQILCELTESETSLLHQSHAAFLEVDGKEDPGQACQAVGLNGVVVSELKVITLKNKNYKQGKWTASSFS